MRTQRTFWTDDDRARLRELWPCTSRDALTAALGRPWSGIRKQAWLLKLGRHDRSANRPEPADELVAALHTARLLRGVSQTDFAKKAGVYQQQVSRWEAGIEQPTLATLRLWAQALGYRIELAYGLAKPQRARVAA